MTITAERPQTRTERIPNTVALTLPYRGSSCRAEDGGDCLGQDVAAGLTRWAESLTTNFEQARLSTPVEIS